MADISLVTANKVSIAQTGAITHTGVAGEAITAGAPCYFHLTTGKYYNADANDSNTNGSFGVATRTVASGEALTTVRIGYMDGFDLTSQTYGATIFVSNSAGRLADAAGSTSMKVAVVVPVFGTTLGTAADKILWVQCPL